MKYRIIFNDLDYLNGEEVNPLDLETSILDGESGLGMLKIGDKNYSLTYSRTYPNANTADGSAQMVKNGESI